MRPRLVRGLMAGWAVLAVAGWGVTQWLGEPAATSGPGPVAPPGSAAEPGPQPEGAYADVCDQARARSGSTAGPSAPPALSAFPGGAPSGAVHGGARLSAVACPKVVVRDGWGEADQ
ncbi:hypothetical protein [Streptomyces sp. LN549]|uniref:hypothetical protein n=1 Tax=Streptomyces sp. LN549 TaxID=3112979 RepID=UPI0037172B33